jgi:vancomycin resistance protein YoaR
MKDFTYAAVSILAIFLFFSSGGLYASEQTMVVASFSTSVAEQDENVKRNIMMACGRLDGIVIQPNSVFSFNDTVEEGSAKNGYVMGRVLYRDSVVMEPGGGLCQVSSTLFNAFLLAGCVIMERHRHFQPVTYVPLGLDATIKYGKKDLKIKNPYPHRIRIGMQLNEKSLIAIIGSESKLTYNYEIYTEENEVPAPSGEDTDRIRQGISVLVYRKKYSGSTLINSALLYKDYYPPAYMP